MDISWLWGHATTIFTSSEKTISLPLKSSKSDATSSMSLSQFCRSISPPCNLNPFILGGNLQTIMSAAANTDVPIYYRRKAFESNDKNYPGSFVVDFVCEQEDQQAAAAEDEAHIRENPKGMKVADPGIHGSGFLPPRTVPFSREAWAEMDKGSDDNTPMLIALHGLSGGSHELYLREAIWPLTAGAKEGQQKWKVCVINARGCAGSNATTPRLFNARATWDCRQIINWCREKFPNRPLFGIGFSLGGNIFTNYLGEEGEKCPLVAGVSCSNPFDLSASCQTLQSTWLGRELYSRSMGGNLKKLFVKHQKILSTNPNVNSEAVLASRYIHEFDRALQAPVWGYPSEGAYYRDASSIDPLASIRIPYLAIHAQDDPVAADTALPYEEVRHNPFTVLLTTSMGGHIGWFETGGTRWYPKPITNFLRKMADDVDLSTLATKTRAEGVAACKRPASEPQYEGARRKVIP